MAAALLFVMPSPAAAQEPEPEPEPAPAPALPAPDPAPPEPPPPARPAAPARPASPPPPVAQPTAPSLESSPQVVRQAPSASEPVTPPAPVSATPRARAKSNPAPRPTELLRRLPTRDPPIVRVGETAFVLASAGSVERHEGGAGGVAAAVFIGVLFSLGASLLLLAGIAPALAVTSPFGERLAPLRGPIALVGANLVLGPAVGYLVVVATS